MVTHSIDHVYTPSMLPSFADPLPPPENVTISSQNTSTQLQWNLPYNTLNNESNVLHVDPHITQYTVYTIDAYTRKIIGSLNKTETSFTLSSNIQDDGLCPMYQVSAWNSGGEGELSEPVQESTPQGKEVTAGHFELIRPCISLQVFLTALTSSPFCHLSQFLTV